MVVYIIYSSKFNKYYVGECEDFAIRLVQHNSGFFKSSSTTFANETLYNEIKKVIEVLP
jgi:putative endonuclease